ncbi:FtsX-like permease family protein [Fulvivirga sp. M361]|uniref:ABC transporter permease n=1 Tax=Fulvivirga sp. M361 TaxID=2594266 RepID=UPI00117ADD99|nr:ABC transporter permease [Fulvivirga sp. M361]TRX57585.1 FtsX-like permease family protein [Fulvivirga sp. M361]
MLKNYFKTAIRTLLRNRVNTIINTLGLSFGITGSVILFLLAQFYFSYDAYHEKKDRIYRVVTNTYSDGNEDNTSGVPSPLPEAVKNDFGDYLDEVIFISNRGYGLVNFTDALGQQQSIQEDDGVAYTQPGFFNIFDRGITKGNREKALEGPNKVVLSERLAKKYFKDSEPVGQMILLNKEHELEVTGVMENYPDNSDFPFEMLVSYATIEDEYLERTGWRSIGSDDQCYILLKEGANPESIQSGFPEFVDKYLEGDNQSKREHWLQPLSNIHFNTNYSNYTYNTVAKSELWAMLIIGVFLIVTACINFVNLSTAIAVKRAKEVGVRKVLGGSQTQLVRQFLGESLAVVILAVLISLGLIELVLTYVNPFLDIKLAMDLFSNQPLVIYITSVTLLITLLAGLYPAFVQARFQPSKALKSRLTGHTGKGYNLRKTLVVFQFLISQVFIISTFIIFDQMDYFRNKDLGFKKEGILNAWIPRLPEGGDEKRKTLKSRVASIAGVELVSLNYKPPSSGSVSATWVDIDVKPNGQESQYKRVDGNYADLFGLELIAGKGLLDIDTADRAVVNEMFCKAVGITPDSIVGYTIGLWRNSVPVVGVVKDFHTMSLHSKIEPTFLINGISRYDNLSVKIAAGNLKNVADQVEVIWKEVYPDYNYEGNFMQEEINEFYESEQKMSTIFSVFSGVAIFIGCLGLFGLVSFMVNQKVKEIGVRKVLGATVAQILYLLSKEFVRLIFAAFIIAVPLAWWGMNSWLQDYDYRITPGFLTFLSGLGLTLSIALLTVGFKSFRAATSNPVDSLRDE